MASLPAVEQEFITYIVSLYVKEGVEELSMDKLPTIMQMKYGSIQDGMQQLGSIAAAKNTFVDFQRNLYL